ncbi:MAG TPA: FkbM family methyltransferase [Candidatus Saccharimonadales bacterium]|nr:FkbM family methyltransferase [Candidatus Saccharimonadales bacterium]
MNSSEIISYARNREDLIIEGFFADVAKGVYVDVGANHPVQGSATKLFYQKSWRGFNIEPTKRMYQLLCFDRPEDTNLNIGVAGTDDNKRSIQRLATIFKAQGIKHIHFLKIAVKELGYEVLQGNDWKAYRPELICIESDPHSRDWRPLLAKHDYSQVFFDGLNEYYLAKEASIRKEAFKYPEQLLGPGTILPFTFIQRQWSQAREVALKTLQLRHTEYLLQMAHKRTVTYRKELKHFWKVTNEKIIEYLTRSRYTPAPVFAAAQVAPDASLKTLIRSYQESVSIVPYRAPRTKKVVKKTLWFGYRILRKSTKIIVRLARQVVKGGQK